MAGRVVDAEPLNRRVFAAFGDVIETEGARHFPINRGTIERFHDLASVNVGDDGRVLISIVEARYASGMPVRVEMVERHPLGSQAFVPLGEAVMCVVVAGPGDQVSPSDLRAFVSNGRQGVNYHRGVWHMPLVAFDAGQRFIVVDRGGPGDNCEELELGPPPEIVVDAESIRNAGMNV